jgi:hypothetical protein
VLDVPFDVFREAAAEKPEAGGMEQYLVPLRCRSRGRDEAVGARFPLSVRRS